MSEKREQALQALENHARRYGVKAPQKLRDFYASEFEHHHGKFAEAKVPGWGGDTTSFGLALTPPTWLNKGDDAINGETGEWAAAKQFLPIFVTDQSLYVVVDLRTKECKVGWYNEETFGEEGNGYHDGVFDGGATLDQFLAQLTDEAAHENSFEPADPDQEMDWQEEFTDDGPRAFDVAD